MRNEKEIREALKRLTSLVRYYCLEGSSKLTGLAPSGYYYPVVSKEVGYVR